MIEFESVGGIMKSVGSRKEWNFGWIPPSERTKKQEKAHTFARNLMPKKFSLPPGVKVNEDLEKVDLTDLWKHKMVIDALGMPFTGIRQVTGSCVGAGGGTCMATVGIIEAVEKIDLQKIIIPFWLMPYGRSRFYFGDTSEGEGSMGSTFAQAGTDDGCEDAKIEVFPAFDTSDMNCWGQRNEMSWSDGDKKQTTDRLNESRKHKFNHVIPVKKVDEVEQGIRMLRPFTTASTLIPEDPRIEDDGEAYGRVQRSGGHQTTIMGVWRHPKKGRLFKYVNQWGLSWGKNSMCWIPDTDLQKMIDDGEETYYWELWDGYWVPTFHWAMP